MQTNKCSNHRVVRGIVLATGLLLAGMHARADVLELKDGKTMQGKYVGGTAGTIRFETSAGVQVVETTKIVALTFTGGSSASAAPAAGAAAAGTAAAVAPATQVTLAAGTPVLVRTSEVVSSKDPAGKRFSGTLNTDLVANGTVVAKAGTRVYGTVQSSQQAGRIAGQSSLDLRLTELVVGSTTVPLTTSGYTQAGARSGRKAARGAAAGATIGAIADEDAGKGAAIGAAAGAAKKGETVTVPAGTVIEFELQQPVTLKLAS
jgi:hypothetical protein